MHMHIGGRKKRAADTEAARASGGRHSDAASGERSEQATYATSPSTRADEHIQVLYR